MKRLRITVNGVSYDVEVEVLEDDGEELRSAPPPPAAVRSAAPTAAAPTVATPAAAAPAAAAGANALPSPLAGIVADVKVKVGDSVQINDTVLVIEAMKMNTNVSSPVAGTIRAVHVKAGDTVRQGQALLEFN
ncbi:biotin/lipoyl-containing protein [Candidatus Viridilinea mediisalina]|uniref:Acetyl-CoA carboxylase biotin carboxyl carrier protein subunit n=1 Tax=Candidatus Viridilinea mediisalina TaxID=2024553 RepID=A0A2A6RFG3_9CHLR|nr:biotin/lipoyl-containing protein [Candidatus Viridilinea mediisalina]PDW01615.1 acetyl-CoA carboxylase biotin carboxyl carrier protein subunit [Candidatus Viridilinea mediisalina]